MPAVRSWEPTLAALTSGAATFDIARGRGQTSSAMRVLYVTNRFPGLSTRGDQLRAYQQIRHLSARHAITLLSFGVPEGDPRAATELQACCERIVVAPRNGLGMAWRALAAVVSGRALQVAAFDAVPARAGLGALVAGGRFDLAHVQLVRLAPMLGRLAPLPCVFDLVDALSANMARRAALDRGPLRLVARREQHLLATLERQLCAKAAAVAVCSEQDRAAIGDPRLHLVSNGVDLEAFPFVATTEGRTGVIFAGNLGYFPNIDAALWLGTDILPRLTARIGEVRLRLVGARPASRLTRMARDHAQIDLIGPVADVHPYLARAAVAVVPMRAGSGLQLKLLEAMASGTPVVATSLAAAGMHAVDGVHLLVADDAAGIADAVARLLVDSGLRQRLAANARALVEGAHSWEATARALEQAWIAASRPAPH